MDVMQEQAKEQAKGFFGHVRFPGSLSDRRMVVSPHCELVLDKVKDIFSPCFIEVISSVEFQVQISKYSNKFDICLGKMWASYINVRYFA